MCFAKVYSSNYFGVSFGKPFFCTLNMFYLSLALLKIRNLHGCAFYVVIYFLFFIYLTVVKCLKFSKGNTNPYIFLWILEQDYDNVNGLKGFKIGLFVLDIMGLNLLTAQ
jgi:hypothetical protein